MSLLIVYLALMITGDFVAYGIGLERNAPAASLPAFLAMYFGFLWGAWVIAVRITEPRAKPQEARRTGDRRRTATARGVV
jgi:hypothetical protein